MQNKPMLNWYLQSLMNEFLILNRRRQASMAALPLTTESIIFHGMARGWRPDLEFYLRAVSELDDCYMEHHAKKMKAEQDSKKRETTSRPPKRH